MSTYTPRPVEHANILIDACGGIEEARDVVLWRIDNADSIDDCFYWLEVAQAMVPWKEKPCSVN